MRKSASGRSLIPTKAQVKPAPIPVPVRHPPSAPVQPWLQYSMGIKLNP